ncbi:dicarboxylate/amino acid:cation symporter [Pseudonocardia sp. MH-G8]|uniref:dicarboxylate/amino acid:cation symporter n=1 Tax=Pseudonocardia sp. MH-G8 TaxID=1854588 RepID=UPI000BA03FE1|nr:dicarboxylate/amino acid:cation symporter [Pseudonocardia sp. MH-G8]OZM76760.1 dicarboxylate/amino acid:cation symporter [Pseudonocardia sp. MH-G8]
MPETELTATARDADVDEGVDRRRRRRGMPPLGVQVLVGLVVGGVLGFSAPSFSEHLKVVGDAFIRLIEMSIIPLIFPLIVLAIARVKSAKSFGRLAGKTLLYFEVVTTVILVLTLAVAFLTGLGKGADLGSLTPADAGSIQKSVDLPTLFLGIIPDNLFAALSEGNLLAILFFAVLFGLALMQIGEKATTLINTLEGVADAMFTLIGWVVRLVPLAVVAFVAYNTAHYGWDLVAKLALFVAVFYGAVLVTLLVVFPTIALIFRIPYFAMLRAVGDLILLAFVTRSSEVVLAPLIKRLDGFGVDRKVPSFTLPIGYSFNADGATMYEALAVVFIAHAYGVELTLPRLLSILLVLILLTKGIAGVPSASIVVLFSASAAVGLPAEGVAILLAVDFVVDMARTALNVAGNSLATVAIAKWEGMFRRSTADA